MLISQGALSRRGPRFNLGQALAVKVWRFRRAQAWLDPFWCGKPGCGWACSGRQRWGEPVSLASSPFLFRCHFQRLPVRRQSPCASILETGVATGLQMLDSLWRGCFFILTTLVIGGHGALHRFAQFGRAFAEGLHLT